MEGRDRSQIKEFGSIGIESLNGEVSALGIGSSQCSEITLESPASPERETEKRMRQYRTNGRQWQRIVN